MRPWIEALEVVFPNGDIKIVNRQTPLPEEIRDLEWTLPNVKTACRLPSKFQHARSYDRSRRYTWYYYEVLVASFGGSKGSPRYDRLFSSVEDCIVFVEKARESANRYRSSSELSGELNPRALEFFDHQSIDLIRKKVPDIPEEAHCGIFLEIEYEEEPPWKSGLNYLRKLKL